MLYLLQKRVIFSKFILICANVHFSSFFYTNFLFVSARSIILAARGTINDLKVDYRACWRRAIAQLAKNRQSDGLIRARLFVGRFSIAAKTVLSYSERLELPEVGTSSSAKGG